jgi:Xaa-Pro dipeptidase
MTEKGIDVFLVSPGANLFYLTGYALGGDERLLLLVLPREGDAFILANLLYKEQVKNLPAKDFIYWSDGEDPYSLLTGEIKKRNIKTTKAALEPQIPAMFSIPLAEIFPGTEFTLGYALTDPLRQYKDESELELLRIAGRESDRALAAVMEKGNYWIGKTETEFMNALTSEFGRRGLISAGASVQVGENAAIPHYTTGDTVIEKGKCLLIDFWARYKGYYTDCTRTFHFGKPAPEFQTIYAVVLEAHLAAEAKAKPGNTLGDVDLAARSVIEKYGYGEFFTHRTGHGLGIDVHEGDSANKGVNVPLKPGMVFSIEPGIYLPGRLGVRIENIVVIGEKESEALHSFPRELRVID